MGCPGYLLAVLRAEKLIQPLPGKTRVHELCPDWDARVASIVQGGSGKASTGNPLYLKAQTGREDQTVCPCPYSHHDQEVACGEQRFGHQHRELHGRESRIAPISVVVQGPGVRVVENALVHGLGGDQAGSRCKLCCR